MRAAFIFAALVAAVAALPSPPVAGTTDVSKRGFEEDNFDIKDEPDFTKRDVDLSDDDFEIPDEPDTKRRRDVDDFDIPDEADD